MILWDNVYFHLCNFRISFMVYSGCARMQLKHLYFRGGAEWAPLASHSSSGLQCLIVIRGKGNGIPRGTCELLGSAITFAWVSIISNFNASVQGYCGVLMVFQLSAN